MFRRRRKQGDFSAEIEAHLQLDADRFEQGGISRKEAEAAARHAFGNVTHSRERFYEASRWMWLDHLARDVRYAWRQMKSSAVSTATVILSLALGIGANTAIFSLADQALLRALPVEEPEDLVQLDWNGRFVGSGMGSVGAGSLIPYPLYREMREDNDVFADVFARSPVDVHLMVDNESQAVGAEIVTGSYFATLGVRPALGRLIGEADDVELDSHPVLVLSHDYWRTRLGADPAIVGKQVRINSFPMTVIGVAEQGFRGVDWMMAPAIWVPAMMQSQVTPGWSGMFTRRVRFLHVFGRLKPGVSRDQAQARLQPRFKAYLEEDRESEGFPPLTAQQMDEYMASSLDLLPGAQGPTFLRRFIQQPVLILLAATALILLLACLNVANLSLARALARRRATALRAALGASRRRILTEHAIESAMLAAAGCFAGALLAPPVIRAMVSFLPRFTAAGLGLSATLDFRVLLFALASTALTTILSGVAPALFAASVQPLNALKQQSSSVAGGLGLRKALVVGQFALALILLIGAGLFARTLTTLRAQGPGYPTGNLLMFRVTPPSDGYSSEESKRLVRRLLAEVQALADVEKAGVAGWEMLRTGGWNNPVTVDSSRRIVTGQSLPMNAVSAGLFDTLGVPVTRGRAFNERDSRDGSEFAPRSAIVNEEFVKRYIPGGEPIGTRLGIGSGPDVVPRIEIVGVVKDFHDRGLRDPEALVFFSLWERSVGHGTFYVRSRGSSEAAAASIQAAVRQVDPVLTILSLRTIDDQLDRLLTTERMLAALAGAFALIATLLAMIGLYGVLSFSASCRTKEIGIRLALGAPRWSAAGLVVREAALLAVLGLAIALPVSWGLGRLIDSQLFGVRPMDATTIASSAAVLVLVCLVASAVPARRVSSVNPLDALRTE